MGIKITIKTKHAVMDDVISFNNDGSVAENYADCPLKQIITSSYVAIKASKLYSYAECCEELYNAHFEIDDEYTDFGEYISDYKVFKNKLINGVNVFIPLTDVIEHDEYCFTADANDAFNYKDSISNARMQLKQIDEEIEKLKAQRAAIVDDIEQYKADYQIEINHALESANEYMETIKITERIAAYGLILEEQRGE